MDKQTRRGVLLTTLALLTGVGSISGQTARLRGRIIDTSGTDLRGVEVVITALGRRVASGSNGLFLLDSIPPGTHTVVFRYPGYGPREFSHQYAAGDTVGVEVTLGQATVRLPEITVVGASAVTVSPRLKDFVRRRDAHIGGRFLEDSLLRTKEHSQLSQVLRRVSGIKLVYLPNGRGIAAASARGKEVTFSTPHPEECYMQIFLDGLRVWHPGMFDIQSIDFFKVQSLMAIEVYRSPAETPSEFNGSWAKCGTIVLWTRDH